MSDDPNGDRRRLRRALRILHVVNPTVRLIAACVALAAALLRK
ncbi:hypothetical protein ACWC5F_30395 [Streptomyces sp. NPDC001272]